MLYSEFTRSPGFLSFSAFHFGYCLAIKLTRVIGRNYFLIVLAARSQCTSVRGYIQVGCDVKKRVKESLISIIIKRLTFATISV